jgi:hypothetical protein
MHCNILNLGCEYTSSLVENVCIPLNSIPLKMIKKDGFCCSGLQEEQGALVVTDKDGKIGNISSPYSWDDVYSKLRHIFNISKIQIHI